MSKQCIHFFGPLCIPNCAVPTQHSFPFEDTKYNPVSHNISLSLPNRFYQNYQETISRLF